MRVFSPSKSPKDCKVDRLVDHLFRHEAGRLVSLLTGIFGVRHLQLAEDVVQEALMRALNTWPFYGIPDNPPAWLMQTAKHLAIDKLRRERRFLEKQPEILHFLNTQLSNTGQYEGDGFDETIKDRQLCLIFICCHPVLPEKQQVALALKVLCGFNTAEIARAFLVSEATMAKRLTRARSALSKPDVAFEIPEGEALKLRLGAVLQALYLLFNEGYKASEGDRLIRTDLCDEAIRLTTLVAAAPQVCRPEVHALLALMCLNAARFPARLDAGGRLQLLEDQDRSLWDRSLIQRGLCHLAASTGGDTASEYHLQATISACHCLATDDASTDWKRVLSLYDKLLVIKPSPIAALNRAVAVAKVHGPSKAIAMIKTLLETHSLDSYPLAHAVLGDLEIRRRQPVAAASHFERALKLTKVTSEQAFLSNRLSKCAVSTPFSSPQNPDRNL